MIAQLNAQNVPRHKDLKTSNGTVKGRLITEKTGFKHMLRFANNSATVRPTASRFGDKKLDNFCSSASLSDLENVVNWLVQIENKKGLL